MLTAAMWSVLAKWVLATPSPSVWMHLLTGISLEQCVGAGSGLDSEGIRHQYNVFRNNRLTIMPVTVLQKISSPGSGGYEMVMAIGGMLRAAELRMIITGRRLHHDQLHTGRLKTSSRKFCRMPYSDIREMKPVINSVLDAMKVRPLLNLGLRLGEGTGAICAYPIVVSSVNMMNEMDNFAHASITKYF